MRLPDGFTSVAALIGISGGFSQAFAGFSQSTFTSPGGFAQAATFTSTNGSPQPGGDLQVMMTTPTDFQQQSFTPGSIAAANALYIADLITNSASMNSGLGFWHQHCKNVSPNSAQFAAGAANGGWKETFTVNYASLNGQAGYLVFRVHVSGTMHTDGASGSTRDWIQPYKNNTPINTNPYWDPADSDPIGGSYQGAIWNLASFGTPMNRSFAGESIFSVPFTFGTSFTLGVWCLSIAGQRAQGFGGGYGQAELDFHANWAGIVEVRGPAGPISGYTIITASGHNWSGAVSACPGDFNADGQVDDSDFVLFVTAYNILDCADPAMPAGCPADLDHDNVVDDADFVLFVSAYNNLICP